MLALLLADKSLGVVMAGVPGAGGDDALFVVGLKKENCGSKLDLHERVQ